MSARASLLVLLHALFFARVLGQILATLVAPGWLPAAVHWFSGALPYHLLLPAQILLLMFMTMVTLDGVREAGYWHVERARTRRILRRVAWVYYAAIVLRYALTMWLVPELRWHGHGIPIAFHFVLASYVFVLSTQGRSRGYPAGKDNSGRKSSGTTYNDRFGPDLQPFSRVVHLREQAVGKCADR